MADTYPGILNTYLNPTPATIIRKGPIGPRAYLEAPASSNLVAPFPGMLLQQNSDGSVSVQTQQGADCPRYVAIEDALQGLTTNDQYTQGAVVRYVIGAPGLVIQGPIPAGAQTSIGSMLISTGDGSWFPAQAISNLLFVTNANSNAVTNTTNETSFGQTFTLVPGLLVAGDVLQITGQGQVVGVNGTDTLTVKLKIGATVIAQTPVANPAANNAFFFDAKLIVQKVGASGIVVAAGVKGSGAANTANTIWPFYVDNIALNTLANNVIDVTATWNNASASDNVQLDILSIERFSVGSQEFLGQAMSAVNNVSGNGYQFCDIMLF